MRKLLLVVALVAVVGRAWAFTRVTADQLERRLTSGRHKSDVEMASRIGYLRLTERLSHERRRTLLAGLPGPRSREALVAVADLGEFLPLPRAELPTEPAPDADTQLRMLALATDYLSRTVPTLPDFMATRETVRYQDRMLGGNTNVNLQLDLPLQLAERTSGTVLYRNHREASEGGEEKASVPAARLAGLSTSGTFGPILGTVLADTAHRRMEWSRWERGSTGLLAVFQFKVPENESHYAVTYCCVRPENDGGDKRIDKQGRFEARSGYRGELAVEPETGTIKRLVLDAELGKDVPMDVADILVEYGPVAIGGKTYMCPLKSISVSRARADQGVPEYSYLFVRGMRVNLLTDTVFSSYRRFRGDVRIVSGDGEAAGELPHEGSAPVAPQ